MTQVAPYPVLDAPAGLEERVKAAIRQHDEFRAAASKAPLAKPQPQSKKHKQHKQHRQPKAQKPRPITLQRRPPMAAIRLGWMAEAAWPRITPAEREQGLPLWRLAALANLKFVPEPASRLEQFHDSLMVFRLVKPGGDPAKGYGWAFVARPLPGHGQRLAGIKIFDHRGCVLVAVGHVPCGLHEKISPYTAGILDGDDELPLGWVYRRASDKKPDEAITAFVRACLPLRQTL